MSSKWTARQLQYIQWCETPGSVREPKRQQDEAEVLGVVPRTLQRWQKREGFWDEVYKEARSRLDRRLPSVLDTIGNEAVGGDMTAAKLALGVTGRHHEKKGGDTNIAVVISDYRQALVGWKELLDEIIPLVREDERGRAEGLVDEHLARLEGRISEAIPYAEAEAGVFRPLLQDKK